MRSGRPFPKPEIFPGLMETGQVVDVPVIFLCRSAMVTATGGQSPAARICRLKVASLKKNEIPAPLDFSRHRLRCRSRDATGPLDRCPRSSGGCSSRNDWPAASLVRLSALTVGQQLDLDAVDYFRKTADPRVCPRTSFRATGSRHWRPLALTISPWPLDGEWLVFCRELQSWRLGGFVLALSQPQDRTQCRLPRICQEI